MKRRHSLAFISIAAVAPTAAFVSTSARTEPQRPAALSAIERQGVTIVGTFSAPGGLTAWAGYAGHRPVALFATPDGKHVIAGTLLDAEGNDVAHAALQEAVRGTMTGQVWNKLEASHWIEDGRKDAQRTVYVFTDPNCPYCNKFWADARPWVDGGKVVLRHVMVGILTPTSAGKAAALLANKNPAKALEAYERAHVVRNGQKLAAGQPRPLGDDGLAPLDIIPADIRAKLSANERLMGSLGLQATPAVVWRDAAGKLQMRTGAPASALREILGAR